MSEHFLLEDCDVEVSDDDVSVRMGEKHVWSYYLHIPHDQLLKLADKIRKRTETTKQGDEV